MASGEGVYDLWGAGVVNGAFIAGLGLGGVIGFCLAILSSGQAEQNDRLTACAKTHNVYQCEMVAVPKTEN